MSCPRRGWASSRGTRSGAARRPPRAGSRPAGGGRTGRAGMARIRSAMKTRQLFMRPTTQTSVPPKADAISARPRRCAGRSRPRRRGRRDGAVLGLIPPPPAARSGRPGGLPREGRARRARPDPRPRGAGPARSSAGTRRSMRKRFRLTTRPRTKTRSPGRRVRTTEARIPRAPRPRPGRRRSARGRGPAGLRTVGPPGMRTRPECRGRERRARPELGRGPSRISPKRTTASRPPGRGRRRPEERGERASVEQALDVDRGDARPAAVPSSRARRRAARAAAGARPRGPRASRSRPSILRCGRCGRSRSAPAPAARSASSARTRGRAGQGARRCSG